MRRFLAYFRTPRVPPRSSRVQISERPDQIKYRVVYLIWRLGVETAARVDGLDFETQTAADERAAADAQLVVSVLSDRTPGAFIQLETCRGRVILTTTDLSMICVETARIHIS